VTSDFVGFVDQTTRAMLSPLDRMKKLLTAPDKRAMILEMVDKGASHLIAPDWSPYDRVGVVNADP
jgi:hypothetical protein